MIGRIIKIISNQYTIVDENDNIYQCIAMGKVRLQMTPFVGDKVEVVKFDDKYGIEKIYYVVLCCKHSAFHPNFKINSDIYM